MSDFVRRVSAKHHMADSTAGWGPGASYLVIGRQPVISGTDRECCHQNAVAVTRKRRKQSFKICPYLTPR